MAGHRPAINLEPGGFGPFQESHFQNYLGPTRLHSGLIDVLGPNFSWSIDGSGGATLTTLTWPGAKRCHRPSSGRPIIEFQIKPTTGRLCY